MSTHCHTSGAAGQGAAHAQGNKMQEVSGQEMCMPMLLSYLVEDRHRLFHLLAMLQDALCLSRCSQQAR